MSCSIAVCNSPVSSLFCNNKASTLSSPHETVSLITLSASSSAASSPKSPFRLRFKKPPTPLVLGSSDSSVSSKTQGGVLKRKRPTRLDIPIATASEITVATRREEEERREVEREGDGYSVYCKRGRREAMEDRFSAMTNLGGDRKHAIFGVYDGHGGANASEFAAKNLDKNVLEEVAGKSDVADAVKRGYLRTDAAFLEGEDVRGGSCCVTGAASS